MGRLDLQAQTCGKPRPATTRVLWVDGAVDISLQRIKTEDGKQAVVVNAPIMAGFAVDTMELANASGGASDPDLRQWATLGNGAAVPFDWSF